MLVIKDTMALIHLAKLTVLETCCKYFGNVIIPELVYKEVLKGKEKRFLDVPITLGLIKRNKIQVKKVKDNDLLKRCYQFNIQKGEAEVVALYWQEKAQLIITDDNNVRKKKVLLGLNLAGTPAILLILYRKKFISEQKILQAITELQKIGWFNQVVIDRMKMEVQNE